MRTAVNMSVVSSVCSCSSLPCVLQADEAKTAAADINCTSSVRMTWADVLASSHRDTNTTALKISTARVTKRPKKKSFVGITDNEAATQAVFPSLSLKSREETVSNELSTSLPLTVAASHSITIPLGFEEGKCIDDPSLNLKKGTTDTSLTSNAKVEVVELMNKKEVGLLFSEVNADQDGGITSATLSAEPASTNVQPATTTVTKLPKNSATKVGSRVTTISTQMSIETLRALRQYGAASLRSMNSSLLLPTTKGAAGASKLRSCSSHPINTLSASLQNSVNASTEIKEKCVSSNGRRENRSSSNSSFDSDGREARFALPHSGASSDLVRVTSQTRAGTTATGDHGGAEQVKDADVRTNLHELKEMCYSIEGRYESGDAMLTPNATHDSLPTMIEAAAKEGEETRDLLTSVLLRYCRSSEAFSTASAKRMKLPSQNVETEAKANFFTESKNGTVRDDEGGTVPCISTTATSVSKKSEDESDTTSKWSVSLGDATNTKSETENKYNRKRDTKNSTALLTGSVITNYMDELKKERENEKDVELLPSPLPPTPELVLFEELVELLTTRNVSADLLDLVRELLSRTKVIPHYHHSNTTFLQQQNLSTGSLGSAVKGRAHGEKGRNYGGDCESGIGDNAGTLLQQQQQQILLEEVGSRECAKQLILILLNQMKEKKVQESMGMETESTESLVKRAKEALKVTTTSTLSYLPSFASFSSPATATSIDATPIFSTSVSSVNFPSPIAMGETIQNLCHETLHTNDQKSYASPTNFAETVLEAVSMTHLSDEKVRLSSGNCSPSACAPPRISPWLSPSMFSTGVLPLEPHHTTSSSSYSTQQELGEPSYGFSVPTISPGSVPVAVHTTAACTRLTRFGVQQFSLPSTASGGASQCTASFSADHPLSPFSSLFRPPAPFFSAGSLKKPENTWELDGNALEYEKNILHGSPTESQECTGEGIGASCLPSQHKLYDQAYSPFVPMLPFASAVPPPCSVPGSTFHNFSSFGYPLCEAPLQNAEKVPLADFPTAYNPFARPLLPERSPSSCSSSSSPSDPFLWNNLIDGEEWWNGEDKESNALTAEKGIEKPNVSSPRHSSAAAPTIPHHRDSAFPSTSPKASSERVSRDLTGNCIAWNACHTPVNTASSSTIVNQLSIFSNESQIEKTETTDRVASLSCTQCNTPQDLYSPPKQPELQKKEAVSITSSPSEEKYSKVVNKRNTDDTKMLSFFLEENSEDDRGEAEKIAWQSTTLKSSIRRELINQMETDAPSSTEALPIAILPFSTPDAIGHHAAPVAVAGARASVAPLNSPCRECVSPHTPIVGKTSSTQELQFSPCSTTEEHRETIYGIGTLCDHPVQKRTEFTESFALPLPPWVSEASLTSSAIAQSTQVDCQISSMPSASFHDSLSIFTPFPQSMGSALQSSQTCEIGFNSTSCDPVSKFGESGTASLSPLLPRSSLEGFTALSPFDHRSAPFDFSLDHRSSSRQSREQMDLCDVPETFHDSDARPGALHAQLNEKNKQKFSIKLNHREAMLGDKKQQQKSSRDSSRNKSEQEITKQGMKKMMCEKSERKKAAKVEVMPNADALHSKNTSFASPLSMATSGKSWNVDAQDFLPSFASLRYSKDSRTLLSSTESRIVSRKDPISSSSDSTPAIRPSTSRKEKRSKARNLPLNSSSVKLAFLQSLDVNSYNYPCSESENKNKYQDVIASTGLFGDNNTTISSTLEPTQRRKVSYGKTILLHRVANTNCS